MAANNALMERVQELKQTHGIGSLQALKYIRFQEEHEVLHNELEAEIKKEFANSNVSLEDVIEACDVLEYGLFVHVSEYVVYCISEDEEQKNTRRNFALNYLLLKEHAKRSKTQFTEYQAFIDIWNFMHKKNIEIDHRDFTRFSDYTTSSKEILGFENTQGKEGLLSLYARAALDGTLNNIENERKIALSFIKHNTSRHVDTDLRMIHAIDRIRERLRKLPKEIENVPTSKLVYRIIALSKEGDKRSDTKELFYVLGKYEKRKNQYLLHAIEDNYEWLKRVLS